MSVENKKNRSRKPLPLIGEVQLKLRYTSRTNTVERIIKSL